MGGRSWHRLHRPRPTSQALAPPPANRWWALSSSLPRLSRCRPITPCDQSQITSQSGPKDPSHLCITPALQCGIHHSEWPVTTPSRRRTGRMPPPARSRRAQVEPDAAMSSALAGPNEVRSRPAARQAARIAGAWVASRHSMPATPSDGTTDARTWSRPPARSNEATPARAPGSRPRTPRSSEPKGNVTVTRSA
jgi:hypothetical protein